MFPELKPYVEWRDEKITPSDSALKKSSGWNDPAASS